MSGARSRRAEDRALANAWQALGTPDAIGWQVSIVYLPWGLIAPLVIDPANFGGPLNRWLLVAAAGQIVLMAVIGLGGALRRRSGLTGSRPVVNVGIIVTAMLLRACALETTSVALDLVSEPQWRYRLTGAIVVQGLTFAFIGAARALGTEQLQLSKALREQSARLSQLTERMPERIAQAEAHLAHEVSEVCAPIFEQLEQTLDHLGDSHQQRLQLVQQIQRYVDDELRPLSHRLAVAPIATPQPAQASLPTLAKVLTQRSKVRLGSVIEPAIGVLLFFMVLNQITRSEVSIPLAALAAFVYAAVAFTVLSLCRRFVTIRLDTRVAIAAGFVIGAVATALGYLSIVALSPPEGGASVAPVAVVGGGVTMFAAYARASHQLLAEMARRLRETVRQQEELLARQRQQLWRAQRWAGYTIHGPVQAALTAAALRLSSAQGVDLEVQAVVRRDLREAFERTRVLQGSVVTFEGQCREMAAAWAGACVIEFGIGALAEEVLRDGTLAECAGAVVVECIQNAVRHGKATQIEVVIDIADGRLSLLVTDNGAFRDGSRGLGSTMLDDLCMTWERTTSGSGTEVEATLVLPTEASPRLHAVRPTTLSADAVDAGKTV